MEGIEKKLRGIAAINYVDLNEEPCRQQKHKQFAINGRGGDVTRFIKEANAALAATDYLFFFNGTSSLTIGLAPVKNDFSRMGYRK